MTTPTTKEIAERIAQSFLGVMGSRYLAVAIDEALRQRDERAAKIAQTGAFKRCMMRQKEQSGACGVQIAGEILRDDKQEARLSNED